MRGHVAVVVVVAVVCAVVAGPGALARAEDAASAPAPSVTPAAPPPAPSAAATPQTSDEIQHLLTGRFMSYSDEDEEITIVDDNGEELIFTVDPGVAPSKDGGPVAFDDLDESTWLTLTVLEGEDGAERVTGIVVTSPPAAATTTP